MKHDLYPIIIDELKHLYGLSNENDNYLYRYLKIRAAIALDKKKVSNGALFNFIIDEINISIFTDDEGGLHSRYLKYKEQKYYITETKNLFMDNFEFRVDMEGKMSFEETEENIKETLDEIFKKGYQKSYKYKGLKSYKDYIKYNRLLALNYEFGADPIHSQGVKGFDNESNHNPMKRSLEEELEVIIESSQKESNGTTSYITEEVLEDFLIDNIECIEDGMRYLNRQVNISGGFVDILAKDDEDKICVIEIKINEDKSLVWQALHYPKEIKNKYKNHEVRMITIAPKYSKPIYNTLKSLGKVEMLTYDIKTSNGEIDDLNISQARPI